jgi:hypothetical protein
VAGVPATPYKETAMALLGIILLVLCLLFLIVIILRGESKSTKKEGE